MQNTMFHPAGTRDADSDSVAQVLLSVAQTILVVVFGLFPLLFIPIPYAPFSYTKILFALGATVVAVIFYALSVLRKGEFSLGAPFALIALWCVVGVYAVATIFSGDIKDALIGDAFGVHTTVFVLLLAVITTTMGILRGSKTSIIRLFILLIISSTVLALFHFTRIIFGIDVLSFNTFSSLVSSPLGSWNGLALYFGLIVLIALVAVEQLPLTFMGKLVLWTSTALGLGMLAIVNFFAVWVVLAVVSLVVLIYSLTRSHFGQTASLLPEASDRSFGSAIFATIVFCISVLFILGGTSLGSMIAEYTDVTYVEVRPSFSATLDIARAVVNESPFIGIGPNKFVDAWRMYKDQSINQTIFWNTNFDSGSGFIPTAFVTTGVVGLGVWLLFFAFLLWHGSTLLFQTRSTDRFWSFIGSASFVAVLYLWGMSFIYTPSATILILTAVCTGVFLCAYSVLVPQRTIIISVATNRAFGLVFVGVVVLVIFSSVGTLYATGQHYSALYSFNKTFATLTEEDTLETVGAKIVSAYERSSNDVFARQLAQYQLAQVNVLLGVNEPTTEQQELFQTSVAEGVSSAQIATQLDRTEPLNWQVLGQMYSALTVAGLTGAYDRAKEAYNTAQTYDPTNPSLLLLLGQLESRNNNRAEARAYAEQAITLKRNYTEALLFLSQIDILENDVDAAIARTQSVISIEPNNPARYYQLGILESSAENTLEAIQAFERAVALDSQYANARYFLAIEYAKQGRANEALTQLEVVAELNPSNAEIKAMIERLSNGESLLDPTTTSFETEGAVLEDGEQITESKISETSLVSPVNVVPEDDVSGNTNE